MPCVAVSQPQLKEVQPEMARLNHGDLNYESLVCESEESSLECSLMTFISKMCDSADFNLIICNWVLRINNN